MLTRRELLHRFATLVPGLYLVQVVTKPEPPRVLPPDKPSPAGKPGEPYLIEFFAYETTGYGIGHYSPEIYDRIKFD